MAGKKKIGKKFTAVIIFGLVFLLITGLHLIGVFHFLEYKSYDMRVRFWADSIYSRPSDEIAVILLEQDSIDWAQKERGWGWPWPRQAYAEIVDYMNLSSAKAVAFDVIFSEPSVYRNARQDEIIDNAVKNLELAEMENTALPRPAGAARRPRAEGDNVQPRRSVFGIAIEALRSLSSREDDNAFIRASKDFGRVVQTVMFSSQTGSVTAWPDDLKAPLFQTENFGSKLERFSVGENEKAQFPIKGLRDAAGALGSITGVPDSDGIIRRIRPFTLFDGKAIPGLSTASFIVSGKGQQLIYNKKRSVIEWDGISIPVDKNGNTLLRFHGYLDKYIPYKAMDILKSAEAQKKAIKNIWKAIFIFLPKTLRILMFFLVFMRRDFLIFLIRLYHPYIREWDVT